MKQEWYCYICGGHIEDDSFILVSPAYSTDRVFLVHEKCAQQVESVDATIMKVQTLKEE